MLTRFPRLRAALADSEPRHYRLLSIVDAERYEPAAIRELHIPAFGLPAARVFASAVCICGGDGSLTILSSPSPSCSLLL